jgi:F-type H+-transporting ATPase subunit epsilon
MAEPMQVEVVSADRVVWSGKSSNIIAKTVEGEIGILPGHEPVLGVLVPSAVVIFCEEAAKREIVAVDGGFISVSQGRVSILSEYARMADEVTVARLRRNSPKRNGLSIPVTEATRIESISCVQRRSFARRRKRSKVAAKHRRAI